MSKYVIKIAFAIIFANVFWTLYKTIGASGSDRIVMSISISVDLCFLMLIKLMDRVNEISEKLKEGNGKQ